MMTPLVRTLAGLCLVALAVMPTVASAATPRQIGKSDYLVVADSTRFAVYKTSASALTVRDDARNRRVTISVMPGCSPVDVARGGFVLLYCREEGTHRHLEVLNIRERTSVEVPEPDPAGDPGFSPDLEGYDEIGRQWLAGISSTAGHPVIIYRNWHTGERRSFGEDETYRPRDLDLAALPIVAPVRPIGFTFGFDSPFAATPTARNRRRQPARLALFRDFSRTTLGQRVTVLDKCASYCWSLSLGGGLVSWSHGRYARGYVVRTGRRVAWRFPRALLSPPRPVRVVQHTRTTVYTSLYDDNTRRFDLYSVRWR
jgi:hypothetical protein